MPEWINISDCINQRYKSQNSYFYINKDILAINMVTSNLKSGLRGMMNAVRIGLTNKDVSNNN
ncbi:hypothetical protein DCPSUM001_19210 [Dysgonomonas capnocytophagoides]|jgi:hypothetical protein|nr:hypothetical protein DCPSUM001_19210 [Dysgonomonas capnocytophagoides]